MKRYCRKTNAINVNNTKAELIINQGNTGYRYSIEPFLLVDFVVLLPKQLVLDIGTGCGIIPVLMVHKQPTLKVTASEIQNCSQAQQNIHQNGMEKQISLIQGDFLKKAKCLKPESFDHIISNPPYRKIKTGRINPDSGKAVARHELSISMTALLEKAAPLLKNGGQISLAYPPKRLSELMQELEYHSLYPSQARFIHGNYQAPAKIVLVSAQKEKKADFSVNPPLAVYNEDGTYSKRMKEVYASFNYLNRSNGIGKK